MRIIHLSYARITDFHSAQTWLKRINFFVVLLEKMAKRAEVISIHCINYTGIQKEAGVEYHFLKRSKAQLMFPLDLHQYVQKLSPDIVIVHGFHFPFQVLLLRWKLGANAKIIIQHHAERPLLHYKRILQKIVDGFVSAYLFTSVDQTKLWLATGQIRDRQKIHEVMEVPSVFHPINRVEAKLITGLNNSKIYLWVGRLDLNKDPITLVQAFIRFAKLSPNVKLYMVFQENKLLEEVQNLVTNSIETIGQIILVGKILHDDLLYWYNSADFILSSSHYEGSGIAVCEGMSCGCIPILTNIPSFRMMTNNGKCGFLFRSGDVNDLVLALQKSDLVDMEAEREKVLRQVKETLSPEAIALKIITVCKNIS